MLSTQRLLISLSLIFLSKAHCVEITDASIYPLIIEECSVDHAYELPHYTVIGEMLFLKPYLGSMPWTYVQDGSQNPPPGAPFRALSENIENIQMDFDFGFRVGVDFNTNWMNLETEVTWMSLHTKTSQSLAPLSSVNGLSTGSAFNQPVIYVPFWTNEAVFNPAGQEFSAQETTRLQWDEIDGVFKIPVSPEHPLAFSPLVGVRGLISEVNSNQTQSWAAFGTTFSTTPPLNSSTIHLKQQFNGVGFIAGLDSDLYFGQGFHLSALFDGALVYGNLHRSNHSSTNVPVVPTALVPQNYRASDESYQFKPLLDAQVALSWNHHFCRRNITMNIHVGYELHIMPRFLEFIRVTNGGDIVYCYDLMLQGLDAGLGLAF